MSYLPDRLIDCHAHSNLPDHVAGLDDSVYYHMMSTFPYFTLEQSYHVQKVFYPNKAIRTLRFANAYKGINHKAANQYLIDNCIATDRIALCGIPNDVMYTTLMMRHPRIAALKIHPAVFPPRASKIYEYFRPEILEEAQSLRIPIILHLPKIITECADDLRKLLADFPNLTVVIAHLGLPHSPVPGLAETYAEFSLYGNLYMDTAMIPSKDVIKLALDTFGIYRIMFGSDEPLNMIRSTVYHNPLFGERIVTEYLYHWVNHEEHETFGHLAKGAIHTQWQALLAILEAISELPASLRDKALGSVFHDIAERVYTF
jgi:predicted TIM-barrel fold metal-dependent hydrolase